jgi:glycosyltransferase involved in cell wall biosynthesis
MKNRVSVIIPAYNAAAYLPGAIESVLRQTVPPFEIIVIDDGSEDETPRVLEPYRQRIIYQVQNNSGPAVARNRGIEAATGDLIAFLDADDIWLREKLEKQVGYLAKHPHAGLVHSDLFHWDEHTGERLLRPCGRCEFSGHCYSKFFFGSRVVPSTVLIRKKCLSATFRFDPDIRRASVEDYDLFMRFARFHDLAYLDEPLVLYRMHASNATKQFLTMQKGELYVIRKALVVDPQLIKEIGRSKVNGRLFDLLFGIGYHYRQDSRRTDARHHFFQALRHRPCSLHTWLLYLASFLPPSWEQNLRRWKSAIAPSAGEELRRKDSWTGCEPRHFLC